MNNIIMSEINWVDVIVAIFLIRGAYIGLKEGLSVELFKTLGVIAAAAGAMFYYKELAGWFLSNSQLNPQTAYILSFILLAFSLLVVFGLIRALIFKMMHLELFGSLERVGGMTLGMARSIIFASLFLFPLTLLPIAYVKNSVEQKSFSGPYIKIVAPRVLDFIVRFKPQKETASDFDEEKEGGQN